MRQAAGNSIETRADGFDRQFENPHRQRAQHQGHDRAGDADGDTARQTRMMAIVPAASNVASSEKV